MSDSYLNVIAKFSEVFFIGIIMDLVYIGTFIYKGTIGT